MKKNIVAIAIDENMFPAAAFLATKLAALNPRSDVDIVILSDSAKDIETAQEFGVPANVKLAKLPENLDGQPTERITVASFLRLFIPDYVDETVERIIYLDADIYPENAEIFRLFDLDMGNFSVAAARDARLIYTAAQNYLDRELANARVSADRYMNGGVLLIDRKKFETAKIGHRAFRIAARNHLRNDLALNRVLAGKWLELSPAMNAPMDMRDLLMENGISPNLTHFIGSTKPWHGPRFANDHPARKEVEAYILKSPWRDFLSKHYDFRSAWDSLQAQRGGATFAKPVRETRFKTSKRLAHSEFIDYLKNTKFADVEQGFTEMKRG